MKHFISICNLVSLLLLASCTSPKPSNLSLVESSGPRNATLTDLEIRGPALAKTSEIGGIAALANPELRYRPRTDIAKIRATADATLDSEKGVCLLVNLENRGEIQLGLGWKEEFDELSFKVERQSENGRGGYDRIEPRPTPPRWPGGSVWSDQLDPSGVWDKARNKASWKVPLHKFYDLSPGKYRALVTIQFLVGTSQDQFFTSITTGPVEFVVPEKGASKPPSTTLHASDRNRATSIARTEGQSALQRSGLLARAGAVELLEFEKALAVKQVRIVKITPAGTNILSDTITGDYCGEMRVAIVQIRHGGDPDGKFLVTFQFSHHSAKLETEYHFFMGSNANPEETYAPRTLQLSETVWTQVYRFKEPESEFRVELLGGKKFEQPGGVKYFLP